MIAVLDLVFADLTLCIVDDIFLEEVGTAMDPLLHQDLVFAELLLLLLRRVVIVLGSFSSLALVKCSWNLL